MHAMNYGFQKISEELNKIKSNGCEKILIFPMYPQYSATTSASVMDRLFEYLKQTRWQPTVRVVPPYYDDKIYIEALSSYLNRKIKHH